MASAKQMLEIAGTIENAEVMAREFVKTQGSKFLGDLQLTLSLQGKFEESIEVNEKILKENPDDSLGKYNYGVWLARKGKLLEGFKHMNEGRIMNVWGNKHIETHQPLWDGSSGKYVLINMEAGIGDQIILSRFIKEVAKRGAKPIVHCSPEIVETFSRIEECSAVIGEGAWRAVYHDCWIPSMSLPVLLETEYEDLNGDSYLTASAAHAEKFSLIMKGDKLKVGIRWSGNPKYEHEQFRLFPEDLMFEAIKYNDFEIYGLQDNTEGVKIPDFVTNLDPFLKSWEDTAGAIANLDLVISSCTAVAHLAAAMGKPTWIITPILPYWSWALPGDDSPWYNTVKLFRQTKFNDWNDPFISIKEELKHLIQKQQEVPNEQDRTNHRS